MNAFNARPCSYLRRSLGCASVLQDFAVVDLHTERVEEPAALPVDRMSERRRNAEVPYWSLDWISMLPELRAVPVVLVVRAVKPR